MPSSIQIYYKTGSLSIEKTTDEDGKVSYLFKDKNGKEILSRLQDGNQHFDTYTVYDQYGHVSCVIPPAAADQMTVSGSYAETSSPLADECYLYHYDKHGRCIYKKQPGCEPVYIIYDQADHPILTQDGNQRTIGIWTFNIPNAFGETVLTGTCKNSLSYTADPLAATTVLATWDGSNDQLKGYVVSGMTLTGPVIRRAYFYDDYRFLGHGNVSWMQRTPKLRLRRTVDSKLFLK